MSKIVIAVCLMFVLCSSASAQWPFVPPPVMPLGQPVQVQPSIMYRGGPIRRFFLGPYRIVMVSVAPQGIQQRAVFVNPTAGR